MATTNTFRGLTAADRALWEKKFWSRLQGLTQEQIDDTYHKAVIHSMFGNDPERYNEIKNLPKEKLIELFNNQTYLKDWTKFGKQKEYPYRDGTVSFDYLNKYLSDEAKIKIAKEKNFLLDEEIEKEYNEAKEAADKSEKEYDNQPWMVRFLMELSRRGTMNDPILADKEPDIARLAAKDTRKFYYDERKNILEDAVNESNKQFMKLIEDSGKVDQWINDWRQKRDAYEMGQKGAGEEFTRETLLQLNDLLNGKTVAFGDSWVKFPGSNYYKAFKDTDVFQNFTQDDKLRLFALYNVLAKERDESYARDAIESWMEQYVHDNQSAGDWAKNTMNDILVGGVANIANKVMGFEGMYVGVAYGSDGLAKWLSGIDPETGKPMTGWWENRFYNPNYWRKVEDYGTFDEGEHETIDANGGISPHQNVYGTHQPQVWSWQTANEAAKMMKFLWSDYLVGRVLGAGSKGLTRLAGGKFSATGQFLAKESGWWANTVNKGTAAFTIGTSAVGISEAYGKMTFDQVQRQAYADIMKRIDADVDKMLDTQMSNENTQQVIENYVNSKTMQAYDQGWDPSPEELKQTQDAWREEGTAYARMQLKETLTEQQKAEHQDEFDAADKAAAWGYITDATLEEIRMSVTNAAFRKYLFDKGTRNAFSSGNPYLKKTVTTAKGTEMSARPKTIRLGLKSPKLGKDVRVDRFYGMAGIIGNGFFSNYLDDVTVGFGKGFGNSEFHNYMAMKYDPQNYDNLNKNFWWRFFGPDLYGGIEGAKEATTDYQSFYDGMIGALGSVTSLGFRTKGIRDAYHGKLRVDENGNRLSGVEVANKFIVNPLIDSYSEARAQEREAQSILDRDNRTLTSVQRQIFGDKQDEIEQVNLLLTNVNHHGLSREGDDLKDAIDAKVNFRYALMRMLNKLANSPVFEHNEWVKKTRQQIRDVAEDNVSEEDKEKLIDQFLAQPANRKEGEPEFSREEAWDRIVNNAEELLQMDEAIDKFSKIVNEDPEVYNNEEYKEALIRQRVMSDSNSERLRTLEGKLKGEEVDPKGAMPTYDKSKSDYAEFGTHKAWELKKKTQELRIANIEKAIQEERDAKSKLQEELGKSKKKRRLAENQRELRMHDFAIKSLSEELESAKRELDRVNVAERIFYDTTVTDEASANTDEVKINNEHGVVLTEDEIMALDPVIRAEMLDQDMLNNYSKEQQAVIKRLIELKKQDNPSFLTDLAHSAILYEEVRNDAKSYTKFLENPIESYLYEQGFKEARVDALLANRRLLKKQSLFNDITEAIDNKDLEGYLSRSMLTPEFLQSYIDEVNPSNETKETIKNYIEKQKTIDENLKSISKSIGKDDDISKEDKTLLNDMLDFLRLHKVDPTDTGAVLDNISTYKVKEKSSDPSITYFEDFINLRNKDRGVANAVSLRPDTSSETTKQAEDKIIELYETLREKIEEMKQAKELKEQIEQPRTAENPGSGESSAAEIVEPTPQPAPEVSEEKTPTHSPTLTPQPAAAEEKEDNKPKPVKALTDEEKAQVASNPRMAEAFALLNNNPGMTAAELEVALNNDTSKRHVTETDAENFVRYFEMIQEDIKRKQTESEAAAKPATEESPASETPATTDENESAESLRQKIIQSVESISDFSKSLADRLINALDTIMSAMTSSNDEVIKKDREMALAEINNAINNAKNKTRKGIITALDTVVSVTSGTILTLVKAFTDILAGRVAGETINLKPDVYATMKPTDESSESEPSKWGVMASMNMEAIRDRYSDVNPGEPNYSPVADYIRKHRILEFLKHKDHNAAYFRGKPIYFLTSKELNDAWKSAIEERNKQIQERNNNLAEGETPAAMQSFDYMNDSSLVAVIELEEDEHAENPIRIEVDGKTKRFQPIALMPATNKGTPGSMRLADIRSKIHRQGSNLTEDVLITVDGKPSSTPITAVFNSIVRDKETKLPERIPKGQPNKSLIDAVSAALNKEDATQWNAEETTRADKYSKPTLIKRLVQYCKEHFIEHSFVPSTDKTDEWTGIGFRMNNGISDGTNFIENVFTRAIENTMLRGEDTYVVELLRANTDDDVATAIEKLITKNNLANGIKNSILADYFKDLKEMIIEDGGLVSMLQSSDVILSDNDVSQGKESLDKWINELNKKLGYYVNIGECKYGYHIENGTVHIDLTNKKGVPLKNGGKSIMVVGDETISADEINRRMFGLLKNTVLNSNNRIRLINGTKTLAKWQVAVKFLLDPKHNILLENRIMDDIFEVSMTSLVYPKSTVAINSPFDRSGRYIEYKPVVGNTGNARDAGPMTGTSGTGVNETVAGNGRPVHTDTGNPIGNEGEGSSTPINRMVERIESFISNLQARSRKRQADKKNGTLPKRKNPQVSVTTFINSFNDVAGNSAHPTISIIDIGDNENSLNPINKPFNISKPGTSVETVNSIETAYELAKYSAIEALATKVYPLVDRYGGSQIVEFLRNSSIDISLTAQQQEKLSNLINNISTAKSHSDIQQAVNEFNEFVNSSENAALRQGIDEFLETWNNPANGLKQSVVSYITEAFLKSTGAETAGIVSIENAEGIEFATEYAQALSQHAASNPIRNMWGNVSTTCGTGMDVFLRDFFDDDTLMEDGLKGTPLARLADEIQDFIINILKGDVSKVYKFPITSIPDNIKKTLSSQYHNMSVRGLIRFYNQVLMWKQKMQADHWKFVSKDLHLSKEHTITTKDGRTITVDLNGEIDLIAYNTKTGEIQLYDFKTMWVPEKMDKIVQSYADSKDSKAQAQAIQQRFGSGENPESVVATSVGKAKSYAEYLTRVFKNIFKWKGQQSCYSDMVEYNARDAATNTTLPVSGINVMNITWHYPAISERTVGRYRVDESTKIVEFQDPRTGEWEELALNPILQPVITNDMITRMTGSPRTNIASVDTDILDSILDNQKDNSDRRNILRQTAATVKESIASLEDKSNPDVVEENKDEVVETLTDQAVPDISKEQEEVRVITEGINNAIEGLKESVGKDAAKIREQDVNNWLAKSGVRSAFKEYCKGANTVEEVINKALSENSDAGIKAAIQDILRFDSTKAVVQQLINEVNKPAETSSAKPNSPISTIQPTESPVPINPLFGAPIDLSGKGSLTATPQGISSQGQHIPQSAETTWEALKERAAKKQAEDPSVGDIMEKLKKDFDITNAEEWNAKTRNQAVKEQILKCAQLL